MANLPLGMYNCSIVEIVLGTIDGEMFDTAAVVKHMRKRKTAKKRGSVSPIRPNIELNDDFAFL